MKACWSTYYRLRRLRLRRSPTKTTQQNPMNIHAESISETLAGPPAPPSVTFSYLVTVTGDPCWEPIGWGSQSHEIKHLQQTAGDHFIEEVSRFYQTPLDNSR